MASSVGKLNKFVALDDVQGVEAAYQVLREFETVTTTRFCSFYSKDFGKLQDQGKKKSHTVAQHRAITILKYRYA